MLEADVPGGTGSEGAYLVVALFSQGAELEYFEQADHLPRTDRYFHRRLTPAELATFLDFVQSHPIETLHTPSAPTLPPTSAPATSTAADTNPADTEPASDALNFRFTHAQFKLARSTEISSPTADDHPAIDLVRQFSTLRDASDAPPLVCSYILQVPTNAEILFADPLRRVVEVWFGDLPPDASQAADINAPARQELRALIYPPLNFSFADFTDVSKVPQPKWYAYQNGTWIPSPPPPPKNTPATAPASRPQTQPDTQPLYPRLPTFTIPDNLDLTLRSPPLPTDETWHCQPGGDHTEVWHYIPIDEHHGQWLGFVVPVFVFDDDTTEFDNSNRRMYFIHDGQLISLPIPNAALFIR